MTSKIKHLAIVSENPEYLADFYANAFRVQRSPSRGSGAVVIGDGYVGVNIIPRFAGRQAGFDHFGFEVANVNTIFARIEECYPAVKVVKRPSDRPFAGISTHDPAGNVFDLSQEGMDNRTDLYTEQERRQDCYIDHFVLRTVNLEEVSKFYRNVFDLVEQEKPASDPNHYLSDGRVTLVLSPWQITDFDGAGIERPALDHIGFKVDSIEETRKRIETLSRKNLAFSPRPFRAGPEGEARRNLFSKCAHGQYQLTDPDGILIDVREQ